MNIENNYNHLISILMPVYNGEKYLQEAIESILNQTYDHFEFIIINDGSIDRTEEIILSYTDSRIIYVKNETNLQIVESLNKGISIAKGKYIARMDSDDISLPTRLEKQYLFMEKHKSIDITGTWSKTFGNSNYVLRPLTDDCEIKAKLFFDSPFIHPSVMFKASSLSHFRYTKQYNKAEDYALWIEMSSTATFANLPEILLMYRLHETQTRQQHKELQHDIAHHLRLSMIQQSLNIQPSEAESHLHYSISNFLPVDLFNLENWFLKLSNTNHRIRVIDTSCFDTFLGKVIFQQFRIKKFSLPSILQFIIKSRMKKAIFQAGLYYLSSWLKTK